ncbi:hemagglutinin repeat-containing protein [Pseudomonas sp. TE3610]
MDARHLAFLARQPSATLQPRERFWGMPKRALAFLLANVMFWQPLWAQAEGIVVSGPGTTLGAAGNGVPVVNIAAPNASGLSHNQFQDYNVGSQGVILNNATGRTQATQLGGIILGNANLNGKAATTILNEVTGNNRSQLQGYTEVAGQAARVIVANPYGITCNGCGFINTPRATLTTGKPVLDGSGRLDRLQVDGGDIAIEGADLNAANVDQFELITRSTKLNAKLYAKNLTVVTGRNDVNADTLQATPRADDGSDKPQLAIDSAALGGMYVGAVKLVGTEKGVGVRLAGDLAASAGDVQIDANGKLTMANVSANGAVVANAAQIDAQGPVYGGTRIELHSAGNLDNRQSLTARDSITLSADGRLNNPGVIEAGVNADNTRNSQGDVTLRAADIVNTGSVIASRTLDARGTQSLRNDGGVIQGRDVTLHSAQLTNNGSTARLRGETSLNLNTPALANLGGLIRFGAGQNVDLSLTSLDNRAGRLEVVGGQFKVAASTFDNRAGTLLADRLDLDVGQLDNRSGILSASTGDATVKASALLDNQGGRIEAGTALDVNAGTVNNSAGTLSAASVSVTADSLDNSAGGQIIATAGSLDLRLAQRFNNQAGRALAKTLFSLQAASVDNRGGKLQGQALVFNNPGVAFDNRAGSLLFDTLDLTAGQLDNRDAGLIVGGIGGVRLILDSLANSGGRIQSDADLRITAPTLDNQGGVISGKAVTLTATTLNNSAKGAVLGNGGTVRLAISGVLDNTTGVIDADDQALWLQGFTQLDNRNGSLGGKRIDINGAQIDNRQGGQIIAGADGLLITASTVLNQQGLLRANGGDLILALGDGTLQNQGGTAVADSLDITAGTLDNSADDTRAGMLSSLVGKLKLTVAHLSNRAGKLFANGELTLDGQRLDNGAGGEISGANLTLNLADTLDNQGLIESAGSLTLSGGNVSNSGRLRALGGDLSQFTLGGTLTNSGTLQLYSQAFYLQAATLDGSQGTITGTGSADWRLGNVHSVGRAQFDGAFSLTSAGNLTLLAGDRLASAGALTLNVASLDNAGDLASGHSLAMGLSGSLVNRGRLSSQRDLSVQATTFSQLGGTLASVGDTTLVLPGDFTNGGRLIAGQNLSISANSITNNGTLGSSTGTLSLKALGAIINSPDTLMFSPGDMTLRADRFSNTYGELYSQGGFSFAGYDGGRASAFSNLSGSIQAHGAIDLNAVSIENAKAQFELAKAVTSGTLEWRCGQHCGGHDSFKRGTITITKTLDETVLADSPMARLIAGQGMVLNASDVQNRYSLMAANGDLTINADTLLNQASSARSGSQVIVIGTPERIGTGYWDQMQYIDVPAFNAAVAAGNFDEARFNELIARSSDSRFQQQSDVTTWTPDATHNYSSTIQSGGTVALNVTHSVQNGELLEQTQAQLTGQLQTEDTLKVSAVEIQLSPEHTEGTLADAKDVERVEHIDPDGTVRVSFTPVDFSGVPFAAVDPTASSSFRLPQGEYGLFVPSQNPQSHYLIETNPNLTDPSKFMSSDYLLGQLGYSSDESARRLGDGRYETRLISDAVVARTGQRFLAASLTSDYDQYRYLMDNALASKSALNLSVGVGLSAQQVAALTHDIVWMENRVIDGQSVLVPVLYLAQADSRNVNGGALIQGRDLKLMAGNDLINVGTLSASNDLSASVGGSVYNGGVAEANQRLSLLAQDSIRNALAGDIRAGQVDLVTLKGDIVNDRTAIAVRDGAGMRTVTDEGGRITAGNALNATAGQDLTNLGAISSEGNANLQAGHDINLRAVQDVSEKHESHNGGHNSSITHVVDNLASTVTAKGNLALDAGRDLNVVASKANAEKDLQATASRDINLLSAGDVQDVHSFSKSGHKRVTRENNQTQQQAGELSAGGNVVAVATNTMTLVASKITAGDEAYLYAGKQVSVLAGENSTSTLYDMTKKSRTSKKSQLDLVTNTTNAGSAVTSGQGTTVVSGQDLLIRGSEVSADKGDVRLQAVNDVAIVAGEDTTTARHEKSSSKSSWGGLKASKVKDKVNENQTSAAGSLVSGDTVNVTAGRDAAITGSSLVSTDDINVLAGRDLTVDAAENTFQRTEYHKEKSRDLTGIATANMGGLDDITGNLHLSIGSQKHTGNASETTLTGSTIGSSAGDLNLSAGRTLSVVGSDLVSTKDMTLTGADVRIAAGMETGKQSSVDTSSSLAVGRVIGGTVIDTVKSIRNDVQAARQADDKRLAAVKGAQAALSLYNAVGNSSAGAANESDGRPANSGGSLIKIGTELASTHSKSTSDYESQTAKSSTVTSGGNLSVIATGDQADAKGDIDILGSQLKAEQTLLLAKNNINLESQQNTQEWSNHDTHSKLAIGASFNIGSQNGFTLDLGAQAAKGLGTGSEVTQVNTTVDTSQLTVRSGRDTTLAGAQVRADSINADIGGNLNIASRQDESDSKNKQTSGGFGGSICVPPFCYGATVTASGNLAASNTKSDYAAVTEQTGLFAGTGGYDIHVGGTTRLDGAVIASEATPDKNRLDTDRLVVSDIKNKSEVKSSAAGISLSYNGNESGVGGSVPLMLTDNGTSDTRSAISEGSITVRNPEGANDLVGLNRDTAHANEQLDRPDLKAMQERIDLIQSTVQLGQSAVETVAAAKRKDAQEQARKASTPEEVAAANAAIKEANDWALGGDKRLLADVATGVIAAALGGAGTTTNVGILANTTAADTYKAIGDFANRQELSATDDASRAAWAEGGSARTLMHTLAGALQGLSGGNPLAGAVGAAASASIMPLVDDALKASGVTDETQRNALASIIAAGVGAGATGATGQSTAGQIAGAQAGSAVDQYNRQLHPKEIALLKTQASELAKEAGISDAEAEKRLARALAYYLDAGWHEVIGGKDAAPDDTTLKYLGIALAPLGSEYDTPLLINGFPSVGQAEQQYTPDEVLFLVQRYQFLHGDQYQDKLINSEYLNPGFGLGSQDDYRFYEKNLNYSGNAYQGVSGSLSGTAQGYKDAVTEAAGNYWSLAKGLTNNFVGTSSGIANGLVAAVSTDQAWNSYWEEHNNTKVLEALYSLQGDAAASAAVRAKDEAGLILDMIPANRIGKAAQIAAKIEGDIVKRGALSVESSILPVGYRDGGTVGAAFNETGGLPVGYRRVINTRTGNVEVLAPNGSFYFETSNGLKPKAGGNLAELVAAEKRIADAKRETALSNDVNAEPRIGYGAKATDISRTALAGPTKNWKTFVNAEKQIQLEAGAGQRVDQVINETLSGKKNFTSSMTLTTDEALSAGQKYLGSGYREIGKPGSGVFHSADGTKEFRIDSGSISGAHAPGVPHVHFGVKDPVTGKYISNNHVPYAD